MSYKQIKAWGETKDMYVDEFVYPPSMKFKTIRGESILEERTPDVIIKNKSGKFRDFIYGSMHPIVSDKLKRTLELLNDQNLEFLKVTVHNYKHPEPFWLMNTLSVIRCMDWERSVFEMDPESLSDRPADITKLVLKEEALKGVHLFRMYERPVELFISDHLAELLVQHHITGYRLVDIESA